MTLAELLGHGSFGIGTFNGLDGEMIILGGVCYRLRGDGSVSVPELTERTPYAVVTNFVPSLSRSLTGPMTREEFSRAIDAFVPSSNYMYALRVTGRFAWASARTVTKQDRPYRPMIEATDGEEIARHEDFSGTIAGFRTPLYESGISVAGCHAHIVDGPHLGRAPGGFRPGGGRGRTVPGHRLPHASAADRGVPHRRPVGGHDRGDPPGRAPLKRRLAFSRGARPDHGPLHVSLMKDFCRTRLPFRDVPALQRWRSTDGLAFARTVRFEARIRPGRRASCEPSPGSSPVRWSACSQRRTWGCTSPVPPRG